MNQLVINIKTNNTYAVIAPPPILYSHNFVFYSFTFVDIYLSLENKFCILHASLPLFQNPVNQLCGLRLFLLTCHVQNPTALRRL